jgi:hypothetical protein
MEGGWAMRTWRDYDSTVNSADSPPRHYTNHLAIEFTLSEFALRFGQQTAGELEPFIHSIFVSSPVDIAIFCQEIRASILRYESRFGPIPGWSDPVSGETRQ